MTFIEELRNTPGVVKDLEKLKPVGKPIKAFERLSQDIACGETGRQIDLAMSRQAEVWGRMANQVVGRERF